MATTSTRSTVINFTGDVNAPEVVTAAANLVSPAAIELKTFTGAGANTVTVPTGGSTVTAVTIIPPAGNVQTITLKGVTGDTGVPLHPTDHTVVALAAATVNFVLTVGGTITGLRLVWS